DLFPLWYLQRVEGHRQDVVPVLVYFPDARAGSFWSRWIFEELATDHPALTVPPDDGTDLPLRLRNYIAQVRRTRPVLITFYDPGYGAPLYPPFDFRALGVGWMPRPFAFEAVGGEVQHTEEDLVVTLQQAAAWYEQGEQGAEVYSRWWARYHDSYEQGYLLARYMVGMVASADLLAQMGRGGEALAMYDRVLAIAPGVLENYRRAVAVARSAGDLPRAERYQAQLLDAVQAFGNINDDAVYLQYLAAQLELARIKVQAGDRLGALAIVQGILRQDPTNAGARRMLEELTAEG
ncbi:MAG TPA: hypothetical protein VEI97_14925, partial [bacterium]|nr:hypothetical protein [bacterium]